MKIVIVGDGKIGHTLTAQLSREGHDITVIDRSARPLQQTAEALDILCVEGNGATAAVQLEAGADTADGVQHANPGGFCRRLGCCHSGEQEADSRVEGRGAAHGKLAPMSLFYLPSAGVTRPVP